MILPSVLVTDTNIWIDLENGGLLQEVFHLPYQFITPNIAMTEFVRPGWEVMRALGLQFDELGPEGVLELMQLKQNHNQLSMVDLAALLLARTLRVSLVTGDRHLSELARTQGLTVHGVLWILDEIVKFQVLAPYRIAHALRQMRDQGSRLPEDECKKRFESWS